MNLIYPSFWINVSLKTETGVTRISSRPLDPEPRDPRYSHNSLHRDQQEAERQAHISLIEKHSDLEPGSKRILSDDPASGIIVEIYRIRN